LPSVEARPGLRLPIDKNTLLGANYRITSQRRPPPPPSPPTLSSGHLTGGDSSGEPAMRSLAPQKRKPSNK
jgi:hypothetical protein